MEIETLKQMADFCEKRMFESGIFTGKYAELRTWAWSEIARLTAWSDLARELT